MWERDRIESQANLRVLEGIPYPTPEIEKIIQDTRRSLMLASAQAAFWMNYDIPQYHKLGKDEYGVKMIRWHKDKAELLPVGINRRSRKQYPYVVKSLAVWADELLTPLAKDHAKRTMEILIQLGCYALTSSEKRGDSTSRFRVLLNQWRKDVPHHEDMFSHLFKGVK